MADPLVLTHAVTLDGAAVSVGQDNRPLALRIESGAYTTPFWIQVQGGGITVKVDVLPWQGVLPPP